MKTYRKVALIFTLLLTAATNLSAASESERAALVALYDSTDGDNWTYNANWNVGDPCTDGWHGVTCNLDSIVRLSLISNNLTGSIPPEIGNLTSLVGIWLYQNQLTGSIPPEIGNLTKLTNLYLYDNQLTGSIPAGIGNLEYLINLYLNKNQLTGSIPPEIGNLIDLTNLYLYMNQLTGSIPPEIGRLTKLIRLLLNNNQLIGSIPPEIGNLTNLEYLMLENNYLSGEIPSSIMDTNLGDNYGLRLNINCNLYSSNPDVHDFIVLKSGQTYEYLLSTQGHCSAAEEERAALEALYYSTGGDNYWNDNSNWKDGYPCVDSWYGVECVDGSVTELILGGNNLTGSIPSEIGSLTNLTNLTLYFNQLTGSIPPTIGNLTNLTNLSLNFNQLRGFIPAEIGNLRNLTSLYLNSNNLTGSIPTTIGNLTNLESLNFIDNKLIGSIPTTIGSLTNLQFLYLNNNYLSGEIPSSIIQTALVDDIGLLLEENCHLYSNDDVTKSFILSKTKYSTYDEFKSDQNHCIHPTVPFIMYLLSGKNTF